jgi:hypothetical protein
MALMYKHYINKIPSGWNLASCQAGTKDLDQVRDNTLSLWQQGWEYTIHSWIFIFLSPVCDEPRGYPPITTLAWRAAAGVAISSVTTD